MEKETLKEELLKWVDKVVSSYGSPADTYRMLSDVDKIIAEAFNHSTIIE